MRRSSVFFVAISVLLSLFSQLHVMAGENRGGNDNDAKVLLECKKQIQSGDYDSPKSKLQHLANHKDIKVSLQARYLLALAFTENGAKRDKKTENNIAQIIKNYIDTEAGGLTVCLLAKLYETSGEREKAKDVLQSYLKRNLQHQAAVNALEILGDIAVSEGKASDGLEYYRRALECAEYLLRVLDEHNRYDPNYDRKLENCDLERINAKLNPPKEPQHSFRKARALQEQKKWVEARNLYYKNVVEKYPEHELAFPALYQIGQCILEEGNSSRAEKHYRENLDSVPDEWKMRFHFALGVITFLYKLDLDSAENEFAMGLKYAAAGIGDGKTPKNSEAAKDAAEAYKLYGICLLRSKKYEEAAECFMKSVQYAPNTKVGNALVPSNMTNLAKLAREKKSPVYYEDKVMVGGDKKVQSALFLASCFLEGGDFARAGSLFNEILDGKYGTPTKEQMAYAAMEAAESYKLKREHKKAKELWVLFEKEYANTAAAPLALLEYALNQAMKGDHDDAARIFNFLAQNYPKSEQAPKALYYAGYTYFAKDMWSQAMKEFEKLVKRYPNSWEAKRVKKHELPECREEIKKSGTKKGENNVQR